MGGIIIGFDRFDFSKLILMVPVIKIHNLRETTYPILNGKHVRMEVILLEKIVGIHEIVSLIRIYHKYA